jgi:hypothetical protein
LEIVVTERPAADRWRVKYTFAEPVRGIAFVRNANKFRSKSWWATSGGDDLAWKVVEDREAAVIENARGSREIEVAFATDVETKQSDYEVNVGFTDGSRLLFTGHLEVRPLTCPHEPGCATKDLVLAPQAAIKSDRWKFRSDGDRRIVTIDQSELGEVVRRPLATPRARSTYVYFGNLTPIETPYGRLFVDPGLPPWMRRAAETRIPEILDFYAAETRTTLTDKPLIFVSFGGSERGTRSTGGGGLHRQVQLAAWGTGWTKETPEGRIEWLRFLGHELFHIWDGDLFTYQRAEDSWICEGAADYFAARALIALSESTSQHFADTLVKTANRCLVTLPHRSPVESQKGRPVYSCGMTFFSWMDHVNPTKAGSASAVFADVFARARAAGSSEYSTADVLDAATRIGIDKASIETINGALKSGLPGDADIFFAARLGAMGVKAERVAVTESQVGRRELLGTIGVHMARCDCEKRIAFNSDDGDGIVDFNDVPECNVLRGVRVVEVEGKPLSGDLGAAYQALADRKDMKAIRFRREGAEKAETLRCREATVPRFRRLLRLANGPKP